MRTLATRSSGLLLHISSLPGPHYNGDLGQAAYDFVDFLVKSGQSWWQTLPVNPVGPGFSPYSTISSFAGDPLFISLPDLVRRGWLLPEEIKAPKTGANDQVNYDLAISFRTSLLRRAFSRASAKKGFFTSKAFGAFLAREGRRNGKPSARAWLPDYALYGALAAKYQTNDWSQWPPDLRERVPKALESAALELADECRYLEFTQFLFDDQWRQLKAYCNKNGVTLIGDLPIFVGFKSADVWANQKYFLLDKQLKPTFVAGCPPDAFNADGQLWGNALYDWPALKKNGFDWWLARLEKILTQFDAVRLDHFIGFYRYWRIPAAAKTAKSGTWELAMGDAFFSAVKKKFKAMPFIAEDLGAVVPAVRSLRDKFGLPGMKVLQFGFDGSDEAREHQSHNFARQSVVYTGTHDNHTALGWITDLKKRGKKDASAKTQYANARSYFGGEDNDMAGAMLRVAMQSPAALCVTPVQDLLSLNDDHRMNVPGSAYGNWRWRLPPKSLTPTISVLLDGLTRTTGRIPPSPNT